MQFSYRGVKSYNSLSTLKILEGILKYVEKQKLTGILSNVILSTTQFKQLNGMGTQTLNSAITRLKELSVLHVSKAGKYSTYNRRGTQKLQEPNRYYINKKTLVLAYVFCNYLQQLKNDVRVAMRKQKVAFDFYSFESNISEHYSKESYPESLFFPYQVNEDSSKQDILTAKVMNGLYLYYYVYIYDCINGAISFEDSLLLDLHKPFKRDIFRPYCDGLEVIYDSLLRREDVTSRGLSSDNGLNPLVHLGSLGVSPIITYDLLFRFPEPLGRVWFTDSVDEGSISKFDILRLGSTYKPDTFQSHFGIVGLISNQADLVTFEPLKFRTPRLFNEDERDMLRHDYALHVVRESFFFQEIHKAIEWLYLLKGNMAFHMKINVELEMSSGNADGYLYTLSLSCRQSNQMAHVPSSFRSLASGALLEEVDLHSACFNVARFLNGIPFDADADVKEDILKEGFTDVDGNPLTKDGIKPLLYRCCFSKSRADALAKYNFGVNEGSIIRYVSQDTLGQLYDFCQTWTGGTESYRHLLFVAESLLEVKVVYELLNKHPEAIVENVYDCFYFDPRTVSPKEVTQTVESTANWIMAEYQKLLGRA